MAIDENYFKVDDGIKKNTIEDVLEPGEKALLSLKPDRKDYILESIFKGLPIVILWGGIDFFVIYMMLTSGAASGMGAGFIIFIIFFFGLHLLPVWSYIAHVVRRVGGYKNVEYVFTAKRILIRSGLIGIDMKNILYSQIEAVNVKVGIWDRMFKVGDISIKTPSETVILEDVHHPYEYQTKIQKIVQDIKADIQYPNDLRPGENHGYNTDYKG